MKNIKSILITGGTGTFGTNFVEHILTQTEINKVIVLSRDEFKQDNMLKEFSMKYPKFIERLRFFVGDVRDLKRLEMAFNGVDVVVHAAAMKQVPACEYNPFEAIKTNVIGAQNVIEAALKAGVQRVIALSTDKAVNPANLYGGTKLLSDKLFIAANNYSAGRTKFSVVRYGNIAGSRGSIIPLAKKMAKEQGTLFLTHPEMTRFWMTVDDAIKLVLLAIDQSRGGEIFVAKNPSFLVSDLLKAICEDCNIELIGIRPGEKLHESLISTDEWRRRIDKGSYFIINNALQIDQSSHSSDLSQTEEFDYNSKDNKHYLGVNELKGLI